MKNYFIKVSILLFSAFLFTACGSGESDSSSSENSIQVKTKKSLLDATKKKFYLEFSMKNEYAEGVISELSNISLDLNTCIIDQSSLDVVDNTLLFNQPSESHAVVFKADFSSPCLPSGYTITAKNHLVYDGTSNEISYRSELQKITIDGNLTIEDTNSIFDYGVELRSVDEEPRTQLDSKKRYKLFLLNLDNNKSVQDLRVHKMTIKSSDPSKVKLIDPNNYINDNGEPQTELTFSAKNGVDLYIQTYKTSGVANFDVSISYTNNRGEQYDIERRVALVILSGEPTAFSINDLGVEYNFETKWFEQRFLISASDKYNNVINVPSKINISAMADFKSSDGKGERILYGKFSDTKGEIKADTDTNRASFQANADVFQNINPERDFLFLFGDATTSEALGKWDIDSYENSKNTLNLTNSYYGKNHTGLSFAVGHNYLNEICSSGSKEWELNIDSSDGAYKLDQEGKAYVTLKFPGYMIGKKIALSVNFAGKDKRYGEVHFQTLYSYDGVNTPEDISMDANSSARTIVNFFTIDTGTGDTLWVKNARVSCTLESKNIQITKLVENSEIKTVKECNGQENAEIAFWELTVELIDEGNGGTLSFDSCQVSSFLDSF